MRHESTTSSTVPPAAASATIPAGTSFGFAQSGGSLSGSFERSSVSRWNSTGPDLTVKTENGSTAASALMTALSPSEKYSCPIVGTRGALTRYVPAGK